jgi:HAMP domain-containing protein
MRRDDLEHGTNAAYVHGCVCSECRAHQRIRMARNRSNAIASGAVRRLGVMMVGLAAFVVGLTVGLLLRPVSAAWLEAVGTWVGALVAVVAVILAVLAFRWSEDFMRLTEHARKDKSEDDARRVEHLELQHQADRIVCEARYVAGTTTTEPGIVLVGDIEAGVLNSSGQEITDVQWRMPQLGGTLFWLSDALAPGGRADRRVTVTFPFEAHEDHRELHHDAEFLFTFGGVNWSKRHKRPAQRLS